VPLAEAPDAVAAMLRTSSSRGVTRARITLAPAELGGVEIHLRHTAHGLEARILADTAQAAGALRQAADTLRGALEGQGVTLLSLDVGQQPAGRQAAGAGADAGGSPGGRRTTEIEGAAAAAPDLPDDEGAIALAMPASGALVDVRA
jgi:flagellar hook-length control protein FliK